MKQNNYSEFLGESLNDIYNENDPPDPLDPKSAIFRGFRINRSSIFIGSWLMPSQGSGVPWLTCPRVPASMCPRALGMTLAHGHGHAMVIMNYGY